MNDNNAGLVELDEPKSASGELMQIIGSQAIARSTMIAKQLSQIIEESMLYTVIGNKRHIHVEAWSTLGSILGVYPYIEEVMQEPVRLIKGYLIEKIRYNKFLKKNEVMGKFILPAFYIPKEMKIIKDGQDNELREVEEVRYRAVGYLRDIKGNNLGHAVAVCSNLEDGKLEQTHNDIASMAQTRVTGKLFRLNFSWIITLAGLDPLSVEELSRKEVVAETVETETKEDIKSEDKEQKQESKVEEKKEIPKAEEKIPTDKEGMVKMWRDKVRKAQELGIDIKYFMADNGFKDKKATVSALPKLLPKLIKLIEGRLKELEG